jgi:LAO/AO transport system kinase
MATRGFWGGLARNTRKAVGLLDAHGLNKIIIETVGVGQNEIDVVGLAHTCAVILMPGIGDNIQALKAGIFEIADIFVINKTDKLDPASTLSDLGSLINSKHTDNVWTPRVMLTSAKEGRGIDAFAKTLDSHYEAWKGLSSNKSQRRDREIDAIIHEVLFDLFKKRLGTDYAKFKKRLINGGVDIYGLVEKVVCPGRGGSRQE